LPKNEFSGEYGRKRKKTGENGRKRQDDRLKAQKNARLHEKSGFFKKL
jgi:ribosomal protein L19E